MREHIAAEYCSVQPATFRRLVKIDAVKLSKGVKVYLRDDLDEWIDQQFDRLSSDEYSDAIDED